MPEVLWPNRPMRAHIRQEPSLGQDISILHFEGPNEEHIANDGSVGDGRTCPGDFHEVIWVTTGPTCVVGGQNVWHYEIVENEIVVSPSIHFVGHFHSPNPVRFIIDESAFWKGVVDGQT